MAGLTLKKLLSKSEVKELLSEIIDDLGISFVVYQEKHDNQDIPIELDGNILGWVSPKSEGGKLVASVLSFAAQKEREKKELARETLEKYKELTLLYSLTEKMASVLDTKKVADMVLEEARRFIRADAGSVMLMNEQTGKLEIISSFGEENEEKLSMGPGEGIAGSIFVTGKAEIINDVERDERYIKGSARISSLICAPLKLKDKVIGVINLSSKTPADYKSGDLKLLMAISAQTAIVIENARLYQRLKELFFKTIEALAETIEKRDPYTAGHTRRVMELSMKAAEVLGVDAETYTNLKLAAILHDIGKIGVRDNVLLKPGRLTDEEFAQIKGHPLYGAQILEHIEDMKDVIPGVKHHHERYDGRGYPDGLGGTDIPFIARIIAIADAYDAMTSDRPYRKGLPEDVAISELIKNRGTQFDPELVEVFLEVLLGAGKKGGSY